MYRRSIWKAEWLVKITDTHIYHAITVTKFIQLFSIPVPKLVLDSDIFRHVHILKDKFLQRRGHMENLAPPT